MDKTLEMQTHPKKAEDNAQGHANEDLGIQGKLSMNAMFSH